MALIDHQPAPLAALDAVLDRAREVVDPRVWSLVTQRIDHALANGPVPAEPQDETGTAACAVIDQMLVDVAGVSDDTVRRAADLMGAGALADLVMASYAYEASVRLRVAGVRLLGVVA